MAGADDDGSRALGSMVRLSPSAAVSHAPSGFGAGTVVPSTAASGVLGLGERYQDLGRVAVGGMAEVHLAWDRRLSREVAVKVLSVGLAGRPQARSRFLAEVQTTALLQHPAIVPVHDAGELPDGRPWFAMAAVRGETFGAQLRARPREAVSELALRRWIQVVLAVCQAVAHAQDRGVVHRDLKPDNVMVGPGGEVYLLDWGLAERWDADEAASVAQIVGTPAYVAPEQARGEPLRRDGRADVFSLGAMLFEVLAGEPPRVGSPEAMLAEAAAGRHRSLAAVCAAPPPAELADLCAVAMSPAPDDRPASAHPMAAALQAWLDGAHRRAQAEQSLGLAEAARAEAAALRAEAEATQRAAVAAAEAAPRLAPVAAKRPIWLLEDRAAGQLRAATRADLDADRLLAAALRLAPDLVAARAASATRALDAHRSAEAARRSEEALRAELDLRAHAAALPVSHPVRAAASAWLAGTGALTLVTDPPGAEVVLLRGATVDRRWTAVEERRLGVTPLVALPVPMGSGLCRIIHPDCEEVRYPIDIPRGGHATGVPPGGDGPQGIPLPPRGAIGADEVYLPAGWFWSGGDPAAIGAWPGRRIWADGWIVARHPVTNAAYLAFLDDLVAQGREAEALRHAPRAMGGAVGDLGALLVGYEGGRFSLRPDADGDLWLADWPVVMIDAAGAEAYADWMSARTGQPWQLPPERVREKASRGVDGRAYPWGDAVDPTWACYRDSHAGRPLPAAIQDFPGDESVYGVRGTGGNVRDWCADPWPDDGRDPCGERVVAPRRKSAPFRIYRGGSWFFSDAHARCASLGRLATTGRFDNLGFRLARPYPA